MKKLSFFGLLSMVVIVLTACAGDARSKYELAKSVEETQAHLPMEIPFGTFSSLKYDEDNDVVKMVIDLNTTDMPDELKEADIQNVDERLDIFMGSKTMSKIAKLIADAGAEWKIAFRYELSDGTMRSKTITYTNKKLKEKLENPMSDTEARMKSLSLELKDLKRVMPIEMEEGLYWDDVELDKGDKTLKMTYSTVFTEENGFADANNDVFKAFFKAYLLEPEVREFMNIFYELGQGVKVVMKDKNSSEKLECYFTTDEIKELYSSGVSESDLDFEIYVKSIESQKKNLPMKVDDGIYLTSINIDGKTLIRTYSLDEIIYDLSSVSEKDLKRVLIEEAREDSDVLEFYKQYLTTLKYIYKGKKSGRTITVVVNTFEL